MALADEEVVRVVRGGYLDDARAELLLHVIVGNDRDLASGKGKDHILANEMGIALVLRIDGNGGIARKRLGTRGGDHHIVLVRLTRSAFFASDNRILDVPEMTVIGLVLDLVVRKGRAAARTPVHDVVALVDETFIVQVAEDLGDGL